MVKVGITHGDINGIGYEVILKTFGDARMAELCVPVIYGSSKVAAYHRKVLELPMVNMNIISQAEEAGANRVNLINCVEDEIKVELSQSTEVAGAAAFKSLEAATADLRRGANTLPRLRFARSEKACRAFRHGAHAGLALPARCRLCPAFSARSTIIIA